MAANWSVVSASRLAVVIVVSCVVPIAATWAVVSAAILVGVNAAQSAVVKPAIVVVERPRIWLVDRELMMEAMTESFGAFCAACFAQVRRR